jgi:hypothetical protein
VAPEDGQPCDQGHNRPPREAGDGPVSTVETARTCKRPFTNDSVPTPAVPFTGCLWWPCVTPHLREPAQESLTNRGGPGRDRRAATARSAIGGRPLAFGQVRLGQLG